jgi:hypothetical protein
MNRCSLAIFLSAAQLAFGAGETRHLFNGRDLEGWSVVGDRPVFVVEDPSCAPKAARAWVWYNREKLGNTMLRVVYRMSNGGDNNGWVAD